MSQVSEEQSPMGRQLSQSNRRRLLLTTLGAATAAVVGTAGAAPPSARRRVRGRVDPLEHAAGIRHRMVRTNGIHMHVVEAGEGPAVLLLHGFPELWYSWRHQLPALAAAGFRAVAPDLRGYGRTDAPVDTLGYSLRNNLADLTGLLDALGIGSAAVVGHDQGATIAWAGAQLHPERIPAVVALGVPYPARSPLPITQLIRRNNPGKFNVVLYFQQPGIAEAELDADAARTLRMTMYALSGQAPADLVPRWLLGTPEPSGYLIPLPDPGAPSHWSSWLSNAELDYYAGEFRRTGFDGAIRRYRTFDFDWSDLPKVGTLKVHQPTLYITGVLDSAYRFSTLDPMRALVPGLQGVVKLPDCGHWTQQERPREVNDHIVAFLRSAYAPPSR